MSKKAYGLKLIRFFSRSIKAVGESNYDSQLSSQDIIFASIELKLNQSHFSWINAIKLRL